MSDAKRDTVKKVLLTALGGMMIGAALSPSPSEAGPNSKRPVFSPIANNIVDVTKPPRPFTDFGFPTFALYLQVLGW